MLPIHEKSKGRLPLYVCKLDLAILSFSVKVQFEDMARVFYHLRPKIGWH